MKYYIHVLKNFANFKGRARRKEYWMFGLFYYLIFLLMVFLDNMLGITLDGIDSGPLSIGYLLLMIVPSLSVLVRRLHDVGKSGWWMLILFVPIIGGIWLFILLVTDSKLEENEYGKNPKLSS